MQIINRLSEQEKTDFHVSLVEWVKDILFKHGFYAGHYDIYSKGLQPIPLLAERNKGREYWQGIYHLFESDGVFSLYLYNSVLQTGIFSKSDIFYQEIVVRQRAANTRSADQLLQESRKASLNDQRHLAEIEKLKDQLGSLKRFKYISQAVMADLEATKINKTRENIMPSEHKVNEHSVTLQDLERIESEEQAQNIDWVYDHAQQLESGICSFANSFLGLDDDMLQRVKVVDCKTHVIFKENEESLPAQIFLKREDILIKYDDMHSSAPMYVLKRGMTSERYSEEYIGCEDTPNYKLFGGSLAAEDQWVLICTDFLSANAIYHATKIKTLAIPVGACRQSIYATIRNQAPNAMIGFYETKDLSIRELELPFLIQDAQEGIFHAYLSSTHANWCEWRDKLYASLSDKGLLEFRNVLRLALADAKGFVKEAKAS